MKTVTITGVNGVCTKRVGLGTAFFNTTLANNKTLTWCFPNCIYDPSCPVNLLCMDLFHYSPSNIKTGNRVNFLTERIILRHSYIPMPRHPVSRLYLITMSALTHSKAKAHLESSTRVAHKQNMHTLLYSDACNNLVAYKHTELRPINQRTIMRILNNPLEQYYNTMVKHHMLDGIQHAQLITKVNKAERPDHYWAGKMTARNVPKKSRRPANIKLVPGSHIVSDIGEVPVRDRNGHKYFVLFKDLCTQFRTVYRMKNKSDLAGIYRKFIADNRCIDIAGRIVYRTKYLVTDDDVMYVKGEVERINRENLICKYTLAPFTHTVRILVRVK